MKAFVAVLSVIAAAGTGIHLASRIPADVVAMSIGVALGALATIPVSVVLGALIGRRTASEADAHDEQARPYAMQPPYPRLDRYPQVLDAPPVVIINPAAFQSARQPAYPAAAQMLSLVGVPRQFHIIGDEST